MTTARAAVLRARHAGPWREATRHPFLDGVRTGALSAGALDAWLVQDHLFVGDLLAYQARLLARAPRAAQEVLASGLGALVAELGWFEQLAGERGLDLGAGPQPVTLAYRDLLDDLEGEPVGVALLALWALERAYLEAWSSAAPGSGPYRAFVEHWTTPEFGAYVAALEVAADSAARPGEEPRAEAAFLRVVRLERDFWPVAP
ncbi:MAG: TenA family transcriptional regulator [Actinomycetota bacterium]|nr:TenA family transcriptional regulator [Actinomycetota bacterium]